VAQFYTIGHSTRSIREFIELLEPTHIKLVADVRAFPRSRTNPQFNLENLRVDLGRYGIEYLHFPELGGRRGHHRGDVSPNTFWENSSFRNYADYAMSGDFRSGFSKLIAVGQEKRCAVMCAEAVWWRCHRRIIADYLIFAGHCVMHILGVDKIEPAIPTANARRTEEGVLIYPQS
jgi:uncharacterized protein (DUF488 family)